MRRLVKSAPLPEAWIHPTQCCAYDLEPLLQHTRVTDLWDDAGEVRISLHPNKDAIIRIRSFDDSVGPNCLKLFFPSLGLDALVKSRNLFAFLEGKPLVASKATPSTYELFKNLAESIDDLSKSMGLQCWEKLDKAELLTHRLANYPCLTENRDPDDIITALKTAELFRCESLYVLAYTECVSRYQEISRSKCFDNVEGVSRRMIDNVGRETYRRLVALARGLKPPCIATIFTHAPRVRTRFRNVIGRTQLAFWEDGFKAMQSFIMQYYHKFDVDLDRIDCISKLHLCHVSLLYRDLCALYDSLVDFDAPHDRDPINGLNADLCALHKILEKCDSAEPPRKPPMPFWIPKLTQCFDSWNGVEHSSFLEAFIAFERDKTTGKSHIRLNNLRYGSWIYIYSVLQLLPPLVSENDDPGHIVRYPSRYPWRAAERLTFSWFLTSNSRYIRLPQSITTAITEASYYDSHCWRVACDELERKDPQSPRIGLQSIPSLDLPLRDDFTDQTFDGILERIRRADASTRTT